jgi:hypothetical protein
MKYVAYVFLDRTRDWECAVTPFPSDFDGDPNWYLVGGVNNLKELFQLMEEHGFDAEYFYEYVDHCMSHPLYNMLNKEEA